MAKDEKNIKIGRDWKPPVGSNPQKFFKQKSAFRHLSKVDPPEGSSRDRVSLHLNQPITEKEKTRFTNLLFEAHGTDWYGCACWRGDLGLTVRISFRRKSDLVQAKMDVGKEVDVVLAKIFDERDV